MFIWKQIILICSLVFMISACVKTPPEIDLLEAEQYITWQIDGMAGAFVMPEDTVACARFGSQTEMVGYDPDRQDRLNTYFTGNRWAGTYQTNFFDLHVNGTNYNISILPLEF